MSNARIIFSGKTTANDFMRNAASMVANLTFKTGGGVTSQPKGFLVPTIAEAEGFVKESELDTEGDRLIFFIDSEIEGHDPAVSKISNGNELAAWVREQFPDKQHMVISYGPRTEEQEGVMTASDFDKAYQAAETVLNEEALKKRSERKSLKKDRFERGPEGDAPPPSPRF